MLSWGYLAVQFKRVLPRKSFPAGLLETDFPSPYEPVLCVKYLIR